MAWFSGHAGSENKIDHLVEARQKREEVAIVLQSFVAHRFRIVQVKAWIVGRADIEAQAAAASKRQMEQEFRSANLTHHHLKELEQCNEPLVSGDGSPPFNKARDSCSLSTHSLIPSPSSELHYTETREFGLNRAGVHTTPQLHDQQSEINRVSALKNVEPNILHTTCSEGGNESELVRTFQKEMLCAIEKPVVSQACVSGLNKKQRAQLETNLVANTRHPISDENESARLENAHRKGIQAAQKFYVRVSAAGAETRCVKYNKGNLKALLKEVDLDFNEDGHEVTCAMFTSSGLEQLSRIVAEVLNHVHLFVRTTIAENFLVAAFSCC